MLTFVGLMIILTIVVLLIWGKASPIVAMVMVPLIGALIAGFGINDIQTFFEEGIIKVLPVATMFIFAILFFGILQDTGFFEPVIKTLIKLTKGNVVTVAMGTALIGVIAHLDGAGATTFLLTVPALLPLYKKLHMSPYLLLLLIGTSAGLTNMIPWAGPTGRAASVLNMDPSELWVPLIPIQLIGVVLVLGMAFILGKREEKRIRVKIAANEIAAVQLEGADWDRAIQSISETGDASLKRYHLIWVNLVLFVCVVVLLVLNVMPASFMFMIGLSLALLINFPNVNLQMERVKAHAPSALMMAAVIFSAGSFLGILEGTGMLKAIAVDSIHILPAFLLPFLHIIVGMLGVPLDMLTSTDAYYYALLPIVESITSEVGVPGTSAAYAMMIGNIIGTFVSPLAPAVWLAVGLAGVDMGKHIRYSFFWMWGFSIILLFVAMLIGII
ncbi:citrate:proton symporter [Bacillus safensis]|uniref:CitMHS family transporter n=1 Tax=Bacillus safensis TaxID=561879 RepID=UPI00046936EC|nr:citrate:proton symporter [Bacillus safensis]MEC4586204.1 citrate:proton symporter [Bacillus safensis]MEC4627637.1 citrate:proton symporter [Bacillus safensis]USD79060.1 citrate:proton symporter [Bacillus safensis]